MKKPQIKSVTCNRCKKLFDSVQKEDWEYNENGNDKFMGYFYSRTCNNCSDIEASLPRWSRQKGEILYNEGLITKEDLERNYKE
jgi:RNase P subunit RPR2